MCVSVCVCVCIIIYVKDTVRYDCSNTIVTTCIISNGMISFGSLIGSTSGQFLFQNWLFSYWTHQTSLLHDIAHLKRLLCVGALQMINSIIYYLLIPRNQSNSFFVMMTNFRRNLENVIFLFFFSPIPIFSYINFQCLHQQLILGGH